jgi:ATP-binding cassette subfamily F protein uup
MTAAEAEGSGSIVVEAKGISKAYDERTIVGNVSVRIARGDRIGIVGANGSGKTTLISLLTGQSEPDSGTIKRGTNVQMHVLDQRRDTLDGDMSIKDYLTGGRGETLAVGDQVRHYASYMKDFLFTPEQARTPLRALSGGERGRLVLAKALATPSNLLVLDEPTNDLDLETLDLLQELLTDYNGTVIVVSHDRDFLDRVTTAVLWAEGDGRFTEYAGGYSDAVAQRGAEVKARAKAAAPASREKSRDTSDARPVEQKKLSFKDKHALETLPGKIEALRTDIEKMKAAMTDPNLYSRDPKQFTSLSDRLGKAEIELAEMEDRWLELEILRESLGG